ncbi:single-stranded-DNA-specific exonuclease RecJ [Candidatus Pelagibacter sp.]|nr:single-stranded-DNA-specific exonuclease RecJ [Candidatus Pelagibacter sp.]
MISVSGNKWSERKLNNRIIEKISVDNNLSYDLSKIVLNRGYSLDEINELENEFQLNNPFSNNKDFLKARNLLIKIIKKKELVLVYGDYDVDGVCSTAILVNFLNYIKNPNYYLIPNRFNDGYGPNLDLIKKNLKKNTKIVIFVDCGSNSTKIINFLKENNIEVLVIDHHHINNKLPSNLNIINPMKNLKDYTGQNICAAALTFYLINLMNNKLKKKINIYDFLFFALLGTICDLMPLRHTNKHISKFALNKFSKVENPGIKQLLNLLSLKRSISFTDISYSIGPMINSPGRIKDANLCVELLCSNNLNKIKKIVKEIQILNIKRKKIENFCIDLIDLKKYADNEEVIFEVNNLFHEGILGIIAGKLKDKLNRPAFVITDSINLYKGSVRSTGLFKLNDLLNKLLNYRLIEKGGGHNMAAGFVVKKENLIKLKEFINIEYRKSKKKDTFYYDFKKLLPKHDSSIFNDLKKLEPFGQDNQQPLFLFENLKSIKTKIINNRHINCILKNRENRSFQSIAFDAVNTSIGNYLINYKKKFSLIGNINQYLWDGKKKNQIIIKDLLL